MTFKTAALSVAALALPLTALVTPTAQATSHPAPAPAYQNPVVTWAGHARVKGSHAYVTAGYRCFGGNTPTHVWVSLKQGPGIDALTEDQLVKKEGTSALAKNWSDTNKTPAKLVAITCDGTWQRQTFRLGIEKGKLRPGRAWLQFCLFDSHADPTGEDLSRGFAYSYHKTWVHRVHHCRHHHGHRHGHGH